MEEDDVALLTNVILIQHWHRSDIVTIYIFLAPARAKISTFNKWSDADASLNYQAIGKIQLVAIICDEVFAEVHKF